MLVTSSVSPPMSPSLVGGSHNHFTSILAPNAPAAANRTSADAVPSAVVPPFGGSNNSSSGNGTSSTGGGPGMLTIFPPTSTRLISNKYDDETSPPSSANNGVSGTSAVAATQIPHFPPTTTDYPHHPHHHHKPPTTAGAVKVGGSSLAPSALPAMVHPRDGYDCGVSAMPPSLVPGHPREGQAASLLGGKYLLLEEIEGASLHRCLHIESNQEYICKVKPVDSACQRLLTAHYRVDGHPNINTIQEVVIGRQRVYLVLPPCHGDLHSYVRSRRRLREATARALFRQVVSAVHHAHSRGIVLRDLKLRKFVFTDDSRTELKLESLEDAVVLEDPEDDILSDKHGCPAYVSPEILKSNTQYSGRAADMWGLGVMLYTMLVGRYPFHGAEHSGLFAKIRRGQFSLPDHLSSRAKCLIRCLLKREPDERLTTDDVLVHPWLTAGGHRGERTRARPPHHADSTDHCVPEVAPSAHGSGSSGSGSSAAEKAAFEAVFRSASSSFSSSAGYSHHHH